MEKIKLNKNEIKSINLDFYGEETLNETVFLRSEKEHYRLLVYLTNYFDNIKIIDASTLHGLSALGLSQNKKNKVITYDINVNPNLLKLVKDSTNIERKILDINEENWEFINQSKFILLDIDPHDGQQEKKFIEKLKEINYEGFLICDDIHLNNEMEYWWNSLDLKKIDVTEIGHHSGTGIIIMGDFDITIE